MCRAGKGKVDSAYVISFDLTTCLTSEHTDRPNKGDVVLWFG